MTKDELIIKLTMQVATLEDDKEKLIRRNSKLDEELGQERTYIKDIQQVLDYHGHHGNIAGVIQEKIGKQ